MAFTMKRCRSDFRGPSRPRIPTRRSRKWIPAMNCSTFSTISSRPRYRFRANDGAARHTSGEIVSLVYRTATGRLARMKIRGWRKRTEAIEWRRKFKFSKIIDPNLRPLASGRTDSGVTPRKLFSGQRSRGSRFVTPQRFVTAPLRTQRVPRLGTTLRGDSREGPLCGGPERRRSLRNCATASVVRLRGAAGTGEIEYAGPRRGGGSALFFHGLLFGRGDGFGFGS